MYIGTEGFAEVELPLYRVLRTNLDIGKRRAT